MPNEVMDYDNTTNAGEYFFLDRELNKDYVLEAEKNDDYGNGISTVDLIAIQRHILGVELLDSPYKLIAADVNADGQVNATDLVELRKLILGIYTELPQNDSWRFVDADATLDINNPWNFDESIEIANLSSDLNDEDFIGVKIGDVNLSAVPNALTSSTEFKSGNVVDIEIPNLQVEAGQTFEVAVNANLTDLYGYQFTMNTPGLQLVDVSAGSVNVTDANFGVFGDVITTSWNTTNGISTNGEMFTMTFKSTVSGNVADMLNVNDNITNAEAYIGSDLEIVDIAIDSREASAQFALHQNEPNPFSANTVIGFVMGEAADATFTVYDVTGKVIITKNGNYAKGYNTITLSKSELGATGVLHYQISSGDFTATKKMIVIE